jgi:adenine-specific DNA-methyltransferase
MRNYIAEHTTIEWLETLVKPGFHDTTQETMLIILKKAKGNNNFVFRSISGNTYISPFYKELHELSKEAKTIANLGLAVKTGNVVWNQVKENLSDEGRLLIYSSNIRNSELVLNNLLGKEKKQYVKEISKPTIDGPVILVGRGYGNSFRFNFARVNLKGFYAENHVNVIYPVTSEGVKNLERVAKSFQDERCLKFVKSFFGNGSISATELETIIPIF